MIGFVVGLAIALRVGWVLLVPTRPVGDFAMYLESATYLLEHGALDREFVYMPGYVLVVAGIQALGGGLLAVKLFGALLSGLGALGVYAVAEAGWDRRTGVAAAAAYALWPAGIAVSSVAGTDMPTAALVVLAAGALVRGERVGVGTQRWIGVIAFGAIMGLAAYVRAVAAPLAAFSIFYLRAAGHSWRRAAIRAGVAAAVAMALLIPWVLRNHARYGEWFLTDSHGGLTALVGANPNTDGRYSRSLNRLFKEVTGYTLLAEPHRQADRASYQLARTFSGFSPAYSAGLVALKTDRLLGDERPLLYWPLYRQGVLPDGPVRRFFESHRPALEVITDGFWIILVALGFAGAGVAIAERRWRALAFVPLQLALVGIYALYFAEVRYQLPIAALMFPLAGGAALFVVDAIRARRLGGLAPASRRAALLGGATVVAMLVLWHGLGWVGERLRARNRWAAHVCTVAGQRQACLWRNAGPGDSPVRGVHDGVGLTLSAGKGAPATVAARAEVRLPAGHYRVQARFDVAPTPEGSVTGTAHLLADDRPVASFAIGALARFSHDGKAAWLGGVVTHPGGPLVLELAAKDLGEVAPPTALWLSGLDIESVDPPQM